MKTATFEVDMTAPGRPADLADHVELLLAELDRIGATDADATCALATGEVTVAFGFEPLPGEGMGELASRGTAMLHRAVDAGRTRGLGPLVERCLRLQARVG